MEEKLGQEPINSGPPRFAKKIEVTWGAPADSPTINELSENYTKKGQELQKQIQKSSDYGEILLWHRRLDAVLTDTIHANFVPNTKTAADSLLKYPGGLAFFAARVNLGLCMGLYGEITYADLKIVNAIRNEVAHPKDDQPGEIELYGFDHPAIAALCDKLKFLETCRMTKEGTWQTSARDRYEKTTAYIGWGLWVQYLIPEGWSDGEHPPWPGLLP